jgi:hypothetical protein
VTVWRTKSVSTTSRASAIPASAASWRATTPSKDKHPQDGADGAGDDRGFLGEQVAEGVHQTVLIPPPVVYVLWMPSTERVVLP